MGVKTCPQCGGKVSDLRNDCPHCQYKFNSIKKCPDCEEQVDVSLNECPVCGHVFVTETNEKVVNQAQSEEQGNNIQDKPAMQSDAVLTCPFCDSRASLTIGDDLYLCTTCKNKFMDTRGLPAPQLPAKKVSIESTPNVESKKVTDLQETASKPDKTFVLGADKTKKTSTASIWLWISLGWTAFFYIINVVVSLSINGRLSAMFEYVLGGYIAGFICMSVGVIGYIISLIFLLKNKKVLITKIISLILMVALLCITIAPFVKLLKDPVSYEKRADGTYSVVDCYDNYNGKVIISSTYNGAPVTSIGQYVYSGGFQGCSLITSIEIPASITSISSSFYLTDSLTSIYYTGTVDAWSEIDFYSNPISNKKVDLYINNTLVTDVEIYSARKISKNAFYNYDKLESVTIGGGVREIGEDAFAECSILEDVLIRSDSVRSIGDYAFRYCNNLENLTIGHGVTSIGSHAFYGCNRLKNIAIPSSVTYIGSYAFNECQNIEIASIPAFAISYIPKTNLKTVAITSGESIDSYAFYECNNLTSVEISGSITSIDCEVFKGCTNLRSINYGGTMAEWDAIFKKPDWDSGMGDYTIYCSDGTISK